VGATSPEEIIEASGTGRRQFYHYFKSKNWLVHEVLQFYAAAIRSGAAPVGYDIQLWEDLECWFWAQVQFNKDFA
jgi:AcrR family transcriptional regulator